MDTLVGPSYAAAFQCIGPACEDMCCRDWAIPLDRATYMAYRLFPADRLGRTVAESVSVTPGALDAVYAQINPGVSGVCPFYAGDRLCDVQREYGAPLLSASCSSYPRALNMVGERLEGALMLSCPQAARDVLLRPQALEVKGDLESGAFRTDNYFALASNAPGVMFKPYGHFALVRGWIVDMLRDRSRPLWHRLLLLGSFCGKLAAIQTAEDEAMVPAIVADYRQILGTAWGAEAMDATPPQPRLQLSVLLQLTALMTEDASCGARFRTTYLEFVEGIAATEEANDLERFEEGRRNYQRLLDRMPWMLENYLVNAVYANLFPFGRGGSERHAPKTIGEEFLLLAVQFFWLNGLLTGVAGCYAERFAEEHVVHAVQSFCREVEHTPTMALTLLDYLRKRGLDNLAALAVLLRP